MGLLRRYSDLPRKSLAIALCAACTAPIGWAQTPDLQPQRPSAPLFLRPYKAPMTPLNRLSNSGRMAQLVRAGKLYLTVQDAIALAIENNIDVEIARYDPSSSPIYNEWYLEVLQAGGSLPGVPSGSSQVGSVSSGQGVSGSQAAAGVSTAGSSRSTSTTANATISQIGPVTPVLDPVIQESSVFSHQSYPQPEVLQSGVFNLISDTRINSVSINQGWLLGGQATVSFRESYLNENAPTSFLNPTEAPVLSLSLQQNFWQGFGVALNARNIVVQEGTLKAAPLNFKGTVIGIVVNVLNYYYGLVADYEDLKAKQSALAVAQQFYEDNKKQVQIGTMAPLDVTTAEAQVASSQQDLVVSETTLEQQEVQLKDALSRTGIADPLLREVEIIPLDRIVVPEQDNLPPLKDLVAEALKGRTDLAVEKINLNNSEVSAMGTENGILPRVIGLASATDQGLSGVPKVVQIPPTTGSAGYTAAPVPYFVGGLGNAVGQVFRRNFPSQSAGVALPETLRNREAQADYALDQLSFRQSQLQNRKDLNELVVDVSNQIVGLQQARVRYQAALKNSILEQQLLDAEQKKFSLGASTTYNVVTQQRDLVAAQSSEVAALVAYSNAKVGLNQTLGTTLEENHVTMREALNGRVEHPSSVPATLPTVPGANTLP